MFSAKSLSFREFPALVSASEEARKNLPTSLYFLHKWSKKKLFYTEMELLPPAQIFVASTANFLPKQNVISIGGTRSPTVESFLATYNLSKYLASAGIVVACGGVPGIDLAAHLGALDATSSSTVTYAVLANPVQFGLSGQELPSDLMCSAIRRRGALLSEYETSVEINSPEYKERLLQRDRLITGLSSVFIAFECSRDSATVDSAKRAFLQGKQVRAVFLDAPSKRDGLSQLVEENIAQPIDLPTLREELFPQTQ